MLIRTLVLLLMSKYIHIRALYIPGSSNASEDSLSCLRVIRSCILAPEAYYIRHSYGHSHGHFQTGIDFQFNNSIATSTAKLNTRALNLLNKKNFGLAKV